MKKYIFIVGIVLFVFSACVNENRKTNTSSPAAIDSAKTAAKADSIKADTVTANDTTNSNSIKYQMSVTLTMDNNDSKGGLIVITKNGQLYKIVQSEGMECPVELNLEENYLFKCSKKGYVTKTFYFDTHVPAGRQTEEFAKFIAEVELHKQSKNINTAPDSIVGGVRFDKAYNDFDRVKK